MKRSRYAHGIYGYKLSCSKICSKIGNKPSDEEFFVQTAKFINKILVSQKPAAIYIKLKTPRSHPNALIGLKAYPKNQKFKSTIINTTPDVYKYILHELRRIKPTFLTQKFYKIYILRS